MSTNEVLRPAPAAPARRAPDGPELRRRELGAFLRSRRERIRPAEVGIGSLRRRRTPGLRREEVAQLAGVGVTWYTWLEQGRDIHPSAQVLEAVSRTLQLDAHEHAHLFTLAGMATTTIADQCLGLCPTVPALLKQLEPFPGYVVNDRMDLLAYNRVFATFYDDLDAIPQEDRNLLWLLFTHPACRRLAVDWEEATARVAAEFRAAMAQHLDDPAWKALVARLHQVSPRFAAVWERHEVLGAASLTKHVIHPTAGRLNLDFTNLWLGQRLGVRMVAYSPADEQTRRRLESLHESLQAAA
ncbi:MAG TPA: helix-turn-helix transcriptional regulator [Miltoncostaeaceae bacterium]|nr:helix-turn-helix transcriptional regulator [Miltoncostaeaceae bacterium]